METFGIIGMTFGIIGMGLGATGFTSAQNALAKISKLEKQLRDWGMHLTPEAPRSSIRALEDYSRTLGSFKSASPSGFKVNRCRPPAGRNERRL